MFRIAFPFVVAIFTTLPVIVSSQVKAPIPVAGQTPRHLTFHNDRRLDHYYWLRNSEELEVLSYLQQESKYSEAVMKPTIKTQNKLHKEMLHTIQQNDYSVPYQIGRFEYYEQYSRGKNYPKICRREIANPKNVKVIIDVNKQAAKSESYALVDFAPSPGGKYLAYLEDKTGNLENVACFIDIESGNMLERKIPNVSSFAWVSDREIIYAVNNFKNRSYRVYRHTIGLNIEDPLLFTEEDELFDIHVEASKSGKYTFINTGAEMANTNETWYLDNDNPMAEPVCVLPREKGHLYFVKHYNDNFIILSNKNAANFRIISTPIAQSNKVSGWKDIIPHSENAFIEDFDIYGSYIAINQRINSLSGIDIFNLSDNSRKSLAFDEASYWVTILPGADIENPVLRYGYTSMLTPVTVIDYNLKTSEKKVVKKQEVLGDFKPERYTTERIFAKTADGTIVPITLLYKKSLKKEDGNPLILRAYGAYGISEDPFFSSLRLSLLNRGFIFAIAHIRGGSENGIKWHKAGSGLNKINGINDYLSCANHLIEQKYTQKGKIVGEGTNAGGTIIAAAINSEPDLFKLGILNSPFVDVLTSLLDTAYTGTSMEFEEWGNPFNKADYDYIKSYSPYDNLKAQNYPHLLINTSFTETEVPYWEAAKYAAKVRSLKKDDNLLILNIDMGTGNQSATGRFTGLRDFAYDYAFVLKVFGIDF